MKKKILCMPALILLTLLAMPGRTNSLALSPAAISTTMAITIYVDELLDTNCLTGNYLITNRDCSGTEGHNAYATIEEGVNASQLGDIVQVRKGIYHEQVDIQVNGTNVKVIKNTESVLLRISFELETTQKVFSRCKPLFRQETSPLNNLKVQQFQI